MNTPSTPTSFLLPLLPGLQEDPSQLFFICGPCQIESRDHCFKIAQFLAEQRQHTGARIIFKASYDKANRSSLHGKRGVGIEEGLQILSQVRSEFNLPVITDVHLPSDVAAVAEVADVLQTPAFLCRQTDLLQAVGAAGKPVLVKKGQFLAPSDMQYAAEKVLAGGAPGIMLCERGSFFGYRDLVVDMRGLLQMHATRHPVVYDATHSVQSPGGQGGSSGGCRDYIIPLAKAAVATGAVHGVFFECHDHPEAAPSDGAVMLRLENVMEFIRQLDNIKAMSLPSPTP